MTDHDEFIQSYGGAGAKPMPEPDETEDDLGDDQIVYDDEPEEESDPEYINDDQAMDDDLALAWDKRAR